MTFNCGYGHGYSVLEVIGAIERVTGLKLPVEMPEGGRATPPVSWPMSAVSAPRWTGRRNSKTSTPSCRMRWPGSSSCWRPGSAEWPKADGYRSVK